MKQIISIPVIFGGALTAGLAGYNIFGGYGFLLGSIITGFILSGFFDEA